MVDYYKWVLLPWKIKFTIENTRRIRSRRNQNIKIFEFFFWISSINSREWYYFADLVLRVIILRRITFILSLVPSLPQRLKIQSCLPLFAFSYYVILSFLFKFSFSWSRFPLYFTLKLLCFHKVDIICFSFDLLDFLLIKNQYSLP